MAPHWHPTTGGLRLKGDSLSRRSHDPEEQQQKSYHLGCQPSNLPGLVNSSTVYPDEDGTQVVFGVDPCLAATRLSIMPTGRKNKKLFRSEDVLQVNLDQKPVMNPIENNANLLLLADVALGSYSQGIQQAAHAARTQGAVTANTTPSIEQCFNYAAYHNPQAVDLRAPPRKTTDTDSLPHNEQQPVHIPSSPEAATIDSISPAEQPANSASSEWEVADDHSPRSEQQSNQTSTQWANTVTVTNASSSTQQQLAQAALQGFTASNPAAMTGSFAPINPHPYPWPRYMPAPVGPSGGRQPVAKKSQKTKPRTTGFNRKTGEGMLTDVCGIATPAKGTPVANTNKNGRFCCPRCNGRLTRPRSVKDHFITCVKKHGNPNGLRWWDHETLTGTKDWHIQQLPTVEEEDEEVEWDEDNDEHEWDQDSDEHEHGDEREEHEQHEMDGSIAYATGSNVAASDEDHDRDSTMGEEDQGRDPSVSANSTSFYTPSEGTSPYAPSPWSAVNGPNGGSDTPGYGPDGYRTPLPSNIRGWSPTPPHAGGSYTPSFGFGFETPVQDFDYDSDQFRDTDIIRGRETEGYGDETPASGYEDDGDSVMG